MTTTPSATGRVKISHWISTARQYYHKGFRKREDRFTILSPSLTLAYKTRWQEQNTVWKEDRGTMFTQALTEALFVQRLFFHTVANCTSLA